MLFRIIAKRRRHIRIFFSSLERRFRFNIMHTTFHETGFIGDKTEIFKYKEWICLENELICSVFSVLKSGLI